MRMAVGDFLDTLYSFLSRHSQDVKRATISPQELRCLQIPRRYLQGYIDLLRTYVPLVPSELLFNIDETGLSDWEKRQPKPVLVNAECENQQLHYPVDRGIRQQTLVCWISG
jgi:hypothetical protein